MSPFLIHGPFVFGWFHGEIRELDLFEWTVQIAMTMIKNVAALISRFVCLAAVASKLSMYSQLFA